MDYKEFCKFSYIVLLDKPGIDERKKIVRETYDRFLQRGAEAVWYEINENCIGQA